MVTEWECCGAPVACAATVRDAIGTPVSKIQLLTERIVTWIKLCIKLALVGLVIYLLFGRSIRKGYDAGRAKQHQGDPEVISDISWNTIDEIYKIGNDNTDLQKDNEWERFKGKRVNWTGKVFSISEGVFGGLSMQVKMKESTFGSDLIIDLKDSEKSKAGKLKKGDSVTFIATMKSWGTLLPISMDEGEIVE